MPDNDEVTLTIEAEIQIPVATVQLARFFMPGPTQYVRRERDTYRVDLSLTPRPGNARACYPEHWNPSRFERIGSVCVLPPGEPVRTIFDSGVQQRSILCHLRPEPMSEWFDGDLKWTDRRLEASLDIRETTIRNVLLRLAEEVRHPGFASHVFAGLLAAELAIELGRYCTSIDAGPLRGGLSAWRLRLIDERLQESTEPPTLPELAQLCNLSIRQLTRGFRSSRGISIGDHVANCRLDHAKRMIADGLTAKAIAYSLGFASASSFCHAFRRYTGESPGHFRDRTFREARSA